MKQLRFLFSLTGATLAVALTLALRLPAQTPPEEPPAPEAPTAEAVDESSSDEVVAETPTEVAESEAAEEASAPTHSTYHPERVGIGSDILHQAGDVARVVVAIMADAIVDGDVDQETVAILGDLTVNGRVGGEAVNILGHMTINGEIEGDTVAVLTSVQLGPDAHVHGDFVSVGGAIQKAPGARIDGNVQEIPFLGDAQVNFDWLKAWVKHCLRWGRPLWFGENLGWVWVITGVMFVFYLFIALIAPRPVARCAQTMEKHPGFSLLTAALSLLLTPLLMIVLAVTGVGPLLLALFMFFVGIFGKTVFLTWLGRRFTSSPDQMAVPVAVLIGGFVTTVIYLVPFVGFAFQKFSGFLGSGIVIYTIIQSMQSDRGPKKGPEGEDGVVPPPASAPGSGATPFATEPAPAVSSATAPESTVSGATDSPPPMPPPPVPPPQTPPPPPRSAGPVPPPMHAASGAQMSTLPRAGFWPRLGATLLDVILIAIVLNVIQTRHLHLTDYFLAWAGLYHVAMWGLKGTTVGGIVFGLKVVRLDDRPMDWSIAIVRGLSSYISLFVIGLGFAWVAFDPERQSWHDKIAGTTIVRVPKGFSLI